MADRTSAALFGTIFEMLARDPTEEHKAFALELWPLTQAYDFNEYQMECNEALEKLGLARLGVDPDYPDEETMIYGPTEARRKR